MTPNLRIRIGIGALGVVLGGFGVYLLLALGLANLIDTIIWLVGGVVLHDGVLTFATIAVVSIGALIVPRRAKAAAAAVFLVVGTVTVTAVPVLGRFGAHSDNPTLLDRNYFAGWLVFAGLVCAIAAVVLLLQGRWPRSRPRER